MIKHSFESISKINKFGIYRYSIYTLAMLEIEIQSLNIHIIISMDYIFNLYELL